jgi:hypothetical protein
MIGLDLSQDDLYLNANKIELPRFPHAFVFEPNPDFRFS